MPCVWPLGAARYDGHRIILLTSGVRERIEAFLARDRADWEAGGILLGLRRDPHVEVVDATLPSRGDQRSHYRFFRKSSSHQKAASLAWRRSRRQIDYVGEWHTHPEQRPTPSIIDRSEMIRRSHEHHGEPLIELILGERGVWLALVEHGRYYPMRLLRDERRNELKSNNSTGELVID